MNRQHRIYSDRITLFGISELSGGKIRQKRREINISEQSFTK